MKGDPNVELIDRKNHFYVGIALVSALWLAIATS